MPKDGEDVLVISAATVAGHDREGEDDSEGNGQHEQLSELAVSLFNRVYDSFATGNHNHNSSDSDSSNNSSIVDILVYYYIISNLS